MSGDKAGEEADYGKGVIFYLKVTFVYLNAVFICFNFYFTLRLHRHISKTEGHIYL